MLRLLLRRLPRFGFLTLFAAMLLFVSGAGWFKFEYDLYREEERLLADLKKAEIDFGYKRFSDLELPDEASFWSKWPSPYLDRIGELVLHYERAEDQALAERPATLPFIERVSVRPPVALLAAGALNPPAISEELEELGLPSPTPRDVPMPDVEDPLPRGEPLSEAEANRILAAWSDAWEQPDDWPLYGVLLSRSSSPARPNVKETLEARMPEGAIAAHGPFLVFTNRLKLSECHWIGSRYAESDRWISEEAVEYWLDDRESSPFRSLSGRYRLEHALQHLNAFESISDELAQPNRVALDAAERTERGRLRIDVAPILRSYPDESIEDEMRLSLLLHPDRKFAVDAFQIELRREDPLSRESRTSSYAYRSAPSDHAGHYVPDAIVVDLPNGRYREGAPDLSSGVHSSRYAYDFSADRRPRSSNLPRSTWRSFRRDARFPSGAGTA